MSYFIDNFEEKFRDAFLSDCVVYLEFNLTKDEIIYNRYKDVNGVFKDYEEIYDSPRPTKFNDLLEFGASKYEYKEKEIVRNRANREYLLKEFEKGIQSSTFGFWGTDYDGIPVYYVQEFFMVRADNGDVMAMLKIKDGSDLSFSNKEEFMKVQNSYFERQNSIEEEKERINLEKNRVLFNLSHDIRTPMTAILGFSAMAKKYSYDESKVENCLSKIEVAGEHLLELINDVVDMTSIETGLVVIEEEACNIKDIFNEIQSNAKEYAAEKDISVSLNMDEVVNEYIYADHLKLIRVFMNIVSNAIKYNRKGGKVDIKVRQTDVKDDTAVFEITVEDNGIGMSKEFVSKIFRAFERENSPEIPGVEGSGLGMSITQAMLGLMGGTIDIYSEQGVGTTVSCVLGFRINENGSENDDFDDDFAIAQLYERRALIVEDNDLNREIACAILKEEGMYVEEAENGEIAIEKIRSSKPGYYDIVLMDIQMPVMDGYQATKAIRAFPDKELADIPIVAMTANAFDEDRKKALEVGMNDYIFKPISVSKLLEIICRLFGER
ncbi:MAG: response regulator [Lachnospiraceae bacterium]|nr:response regulator [Lachnospiraceae bacterium]